MNATLNQSANGANNTVEIHFNNIGNTIIGPTSAYFKLGEALKRKTPALSPHGFVIVGNESDILRLADYVTTFGNCIKTRAAWVNTFKLSGVVIKGMEAA